MMFSRSGSRRAGDLCESQHPPDPFALEEQERKREARDCPDHSTRLESRVHLLILNQKNFKTTHQYETESYRASTLWKWTWADSPDMSATTFFRKCAIAVLRTMAALLPEQARQPIRQHQLILSKPAVDSIVLLS